MSPMRRLFVVYVRPHLWLFVAGVICLFLTNYLPFPFHKSLRGH